MNLRTMVHRFQRLEWLVAGLILLYLVPLWLFQYLPTQDGPSHLNNAQILSQYYNPSFNYQKIYELWLYPFPNWLAHAPLAALMGFVPPLIAEKILLSMYVIVFPMAFIYFLSALDPAKKSLGLFSFVFIYNHPLIKGFYSFAFSIPLAFLCLGYYWKHRNGFNFWQLLIITGLLLLVYFGHMVTYLIVIGSIAFIAVMVFLSQWRNLHGAALRRALATMELSLVSVMPTLLLLVNYYSNSSFDGVKLNINLSHTPQLLNDFFSMNVLVSFSKYQGWTTQAVAWVMAVIFLITLVLRLSQFRSKPVHFFKFGDGFFCLFLILFVLYLLMPDAFGSGNYLKERLILLGFLFLLAWCEVSLPILPDRAATDTPVYSNNPSLGIAFLNEERMAGLQSKSKRIYPVILELMCVLAVLLMLAGVYNSFETVEPVLQEYVAGQTVIRPNTVLLPLNFLNVYKYYNRVNPLLHADHYLTMTNGTIDLGNYEPFDDYFPVRYKTGLNLPIYGNHMSWPDMLHYHDHSIKLCNYTHMIDYLLVFGDPDLYFKNDILRCYTPLYIQGTERIYVPKR